MLDIAGVEVWITETMVVTWIIMAVLILLAVLVRVKLKNFSQVPKGFQNVVEALIDAIDNFVKDTAGEKLQGLSNWFFMVIIFMFSSIVAGMVGLRPPNADWTMTFALALATMIIIQIMGVKYRKGEYLKGFLQPFFLFLPLNIIGEISRPISLSFRLFGNMFAGMIIMALAYNLMPIWARFGLPAALHAYFDLIAGAIQMYIFVTLSLSFIAGATSSPDE